MKKILVFVAKNFAYILTFCVPKNKKIIIFGSWFGQKFADNPKYLFLAAMKDETLRPIWVTKSKSVYYELKQLGYPVVIYYSFASFLYHIRAASYVTATGKVDVLYWLTGGAHHIELWHGIPLKKIVYDDSFGLGKETTQTSRLKNFFHDRNYSISFCSEAYRDIYKSAFRVSDSNLVCLGQPRNDVFFDSSLEISNLITPFQPENFILYMPTHRKEGKEKINLGDIMNLAEINDFCIKRNIYFCVKKHHYHSGEFDDLSMYTAIIDITNEVVDSQILMKHASMLITDYSSCYIDYLLLNKPIIMFPYDIQDYMGSDRDLYFNYEDVIPGKICNSKQELTIELINSFDNPQLTIKQRKCRDFFYDEMNQCSVSGKIVDYFFKK